MSRPGREQPLLSAFGVSDSPDVALSSAHKHGASSRSGEVDDGLRRRPHGDIASIGRRTAPGAQANADAITAMLPAVGP